VVLKACFYLGCAVDDFCIVFRSDEVDAVPSVWTDEKTDPMMCHWPPYPTNARVTKSKLDMERRDDKWASFPVKIMYRAGARVCVCGRVCNFFYTVLFSSD
jgi:hypothetical protein